ncbi:unnamed protein product [Symbiodinium sp. CCMP2456]|nr:unnamed protein product [Symbiodinium sp. CCMP2456]
MAMDWSLSHQDLQWLHWEPKDPGNAQSRTRRPRSFARSLERQRPWASRHSPRELHHPEERLQLSRWLETTASASLLSRPARGVEWKSYGSALRLLRAVPSNASPFLVNHSRDCLEQSSRDPQVLRLRAASLQKPLNLAPQLSLGSTTWPLANEREMEAQVAPALLGARARARALGESQSSDEATPTEAESDGQSFLLVTSGEFCEGTARSRATWREPERSRADLEAWEREEEVEHRKAGRAYHPIPSAEVLQLLGEVPPGLSGRYSSRLRAEAQRRRASAVSEGSGGCGGLMRTWHRWLLLVLLLSDTASRQRSLAAALAADLSSALPFRREIETAAEPSAPLSARTARTTRSRAEFDEAPEACADALGRAEDEAISLEVLSRRDILGYHQMLLAIHDWTSTLRRPKAGAGAPQVSGASSAASASTVAECLAAESSRYLDLVKRLRSAFLASHRRAATARSHWTLERQTRLLPASRP